MTLLLILKYLFKKNKSIESIKEYIPDLEISNNSLRRM